MRFCSYCGAELQDGVEICEKCGCRVVHAPVNISTLKPKLNVLALIGFILSIVSSLASVFFIRYDEPGTVAFFSSVILALAGIVCSIVGLVNAKRNGQLGKGLAISGIVIGSIVGALWLLVMTIGLVFVALIFAWIIALFGGI